MGFNFSVDDDTVELLVFVWGPCSWFTRSHEFTSRTVSKVMNCPQTFVARNKNDSTV